MHAGLGIVQQVFEVIEIGLHPLRTAQAKWATIVVGIGHELHAAAEQRAQWPFRPQAAHQAQCALAHAVVTTLERHHGAAPGGGAHQFQRRFHGVGAGRAAELDFRLCGQRWRQQAEQVLDKLILDWRGQVEGVQRQFIGQHLLDRFDHHRVVMPQCQRSRAGQAVDEATPLDIFDMNALGALEGQGNAPRVAAGIGFLLALAGQ
ncbi:hypothetical protein D3C73_726990 [compost metagenome]